MSCNRDFTVCRNVKDSAQGVYIPSPLKHKKVSAIIQIARAAIRSRMSHHLAGEPDRVQGGVRKSQSKSSLILARSPGQNLGPLGTQKNPFGLPSFSHSPR